MHESFKVELHDGILILNAETTRAAHIEHAATVDVVGDMIVVRPAHAEPARDNAPAAQQAGESAADRSFGMLKGLSAEFIHKLAMSKDLDNDI